MNWNDYIDKSYENMIACVGSENKNYLRNLSQEELRKFVDDIATIEYIEKDRWHAEQDVKDIIFDEFARYDMDDTYWLGRFVTCLSANNPIMADRIAQKCANDINSDAVYHWVLDYIEE